MGQTAEKLAKISTGSPHDQHDNPRLAENSRRHKFVEAFAREVGKMVVETVTEGFHVGVQQLENICDSYQLSPEEQKRLRQQVTDFAPKFSTWFHKRFNNAMSATVGINSRYSDQVVNNDQEAAYQATEHLISQGCKKIAHLRGDLMPQISIDRFLGYKKALEHNQIPYEEDLVAICSENNFEEGFNSVLKLLEKHPDLDGLFAITDLVAVGALRAFEERGYRVPEDVAVIGFSNWMISSLITPQLSTVEQNGARIGKKVLQLFLKTQESDTMEPDTSYVQETVKTQLLIRASSKRKEI